MSTLPVSVQAIFDANGEARASTGPSVYGIDWHISRLVTNSDSPTICELSVYRNSESPTTKEDHTFIGNDDSSETNIVLRSGESILFVWSNGTTGSHATAIISGEIVGR